jgi:5-methylcytosine-specific restriction protein A
MARACERQCGRLASHGSVCDECRKQKTLPATPPVGRESSARRGYGYRWQRYSAGRLRSHPLCADPHRRHVGIYVAARQTDHIIPVEGPWDPLFWDKDNHQSLCNGCHSYKTALEDGGFGNKSPVINA